MIVAASIFWTGIVPFVIYFVVVFAACFVVSESAQNYFYDEPTPYLGWKSAAAAAILAFLLTVTKISFPEMFMGQVGLTVLHAIAWFAAFTLILRYQPQHALAISLPTMLLVTIIASMGVQSLRESSDRGVEAEPKVYSIPRRPATGAPVPPAPEPKPESETE